MLQHTATPCNVLQRAATHCLMLQHTATHRNIRIIPQHFSSIAQMTPILPSKRDQLSRFDMTTHVIEMTPTEPFKQTHLIMPSIFEGVGKKMTGAITTSQQQSARNLHILNSNQLTFKCMSCRTAANHTATHCSALQCTAMHCNTPQRMIFECVSCHTAANHTATHCNTLQHTATHRNTPQRMTFECISCHTAANHNNNKQRMANAAHCNAADHCNTLQHTPKHRNTPQHTATNDI